jgi:predicted regulator of Ras-like GTPase activity (Roadblock/LC7/MglB family)
MRRGDAIGSIGTNDLEELDRLLASFLTEARARCALLVDRGGRLLVTHGDTGGIDAVTFASLAAADFAAGDQIATLLGETEFASLYHHGERQSMYLADLSGWAILAALFDGRTTWGMVRVKSKAVVPRFAAAFDALARRGPSGSVVQMEAGWADDAEQEIDRLFTD